MIKVKKPSCPQEKIFESCTSNMRKDSRRKRIQASKKVIQEAHIEYESLAQIEKLYSLDPSEELEGGAKKEDMVWLYDKKFVLDRGREYYNKIKSLPEYGTCPYCGQRKVSTLDHYLPKTKYPLFAILPLNLIGACSDCNKAKKDIDFDSLEDAPIHPYYDDFSDSIWLCSRLITEIPIGFEFTVKRPDKWDKTKFKRAKHHFEQLNLSDLYSSHAAEEYAENNHRYMQMFKTGANYLYFK